MGRDPLFRVGLPLWAVGAALGIAAQVTLLAWAGVAVMAAGLCLIVTAALRA